MALNRLPKQRIPRSQKNLEWGKKCIDAFIEEGSFSTKTTQEFRDLYELYNGKLKDSEYAYVTNPYKLDSKYKLPARMRNYNIIRPVIDLLLGEKSRRPLSPAVYVKNADVISRKKESESKLALAYYQQMFVNELNQQGVDTGMPSKELPDMEEIRKGFEENYNDARAIMGQEALDYLVDNLELKDELMKGFFDWLVTGYVYSYKGVAFNDVEYEIVNPLDIAYGVSPGTTFIEDGEWVVRRSEMTLHEVIDRFHDLLKEKDLAILENNVTDDTWVRLQSILGNKNISLPGENRTLVVYHVVWKSQRKIGFLTYLNELGEEEEMVVDETYVPDKDAGETVKWEWINHVWEGYRIDNKVYLSIQPIEAQRVSLSNISRCKLPYNGRAYSDRNAENTSVAQIGKIYQVLYNIFHFRLELSVAKNKDKIALMEINSIPKRHGWDEEKFMYHADANGFAFVDGNAKGKNHEQVTFNQWQVLDMSLGKYIDTQLNLLSAVKAEWEETLGITRQRKGNILASDGMSTTERAVFQSSVMTEELFRKFETFQDREFQGLLDISQVAWKNGKKGSYMRNDATQAYLDVIPDEYCASDFGVFAKISAEESEKLSQLRALALEFAQNGSRPSMIAEILDSNSFSKIKRKLKEVDEAAQALEQRQIQAEQEAAAALKQAEIEHREDLQEHDNLNKSLDRLHEKEMLLLKLDNEAAGLDPQTEVNRDREKLNLEREKLREEVRLTREEISSRERIEDKRLQVAREQIQSQERIAKSRPKTVTKTK